MKRKLVFLLIAALLLTPWPVAYAYDETIAGNMPMYITAAEPDVAPKLNAFGYTIGSVTSGELFHIDTSNTIVDTMFTLYITNTDELVQHYRYMNLNVAIYVQTGINQWEKMITDEDGIPQETYITMHTGMANFILPGYGQYKVTIDKGCFYFYGRAIDSSNIAPTFYLTAS